MAFKKSLLAVVAALALTAGAGAETYTGFPAYLATRPVVSPPYTGGEYIPFLDGNKIKLAPADNFLTLDGIQEMTHKTIDCNKNTCLNFHNTNLMNWDDPPPSTCVGRPDGTLYNKNGLPAICGASYLALHSGGHIALHAGGALLLR